MERVGHVHLPKTAGTAINTALRIASGVEEFHVLQIADVGDEGHFWPGRTLYRGTAQFSAVCAAPFVAGHLSVAKMAELDRTFMFTVLRDPAARLLSNYVFERARARSTEAAGHPVTNRRDADALAHSPVRYAAEHRHLLTAAKFFARDEGYYEVLEASDEHSVDLVERQVDALVRDRMRRLDRVYLDESPQQVVDEICSRWGVPSVEVRRENESEAIDVPPFSADELCSVLARVLLVDYVLFDHLFRTDRFSSTMHEAIASAVDRFVERHPKNIG